MEPSDAVYWDIDEASPVASCGVFCVRPGFTRRRVRPQLTWFSIWVLTTVVAAGLHPNPNGHGTHTQLGLPPCPSVILWDRPCPACGLTTSFVALIHGDFHAAWAAHPFGPFLYAVFTFSAALALVGFVRIRQIELTRLGHWAVAGLVMAYLAFGIARFAVSPPFGGGGIALSARSAARP